MVAFKQLEWITDSSGCVHADPKGLRWMYYIAPLENKQYQLILTDEHIDWNRDLILFCTSVADGKQKAEEHYITTLKSFILD